MSMEYVCLLPFSVSFLCAVTTAFAVQRKGQGSSLCAAVLPEGSGSKDHGVAVRTPRHFHGSKQTPVARCLRA